MQEIYKTSFLQQVRSSKYIVGLTSLVFLFYYFILLTSDETISLKAFAGAVPILPILSIFLFPAIYLHITYYINNFQLIIKIDREKDLLTVIRFGSKQLYSFSNIISTEQHLGLYYRNRIDRLGRRIAPWTPYGYLLLKLDDGQEFHITSLMIDIHNPPFKITHSYFRFFPYLKPGMKISDKRALINNNFKNEISNYKATFKNHSDQQLKEKINNETAYDKASVEAARQILAIRHKQV